MDGVLAKTTGFFIIKIVIIIEVFIYHKPRPSITNKKFPYNFNSIPYLKTNLKAKLSKSK